jgi:hypothetical protein
MESEGLPEQHAAPDRGVRDMNALIAGTGRLALFGAVLLLFGPQVACPQSSSPLAEADDSAAEDPLGTARRSRIAVLAESWPTTPDFTPPYDALDPTVATLKTRKVSRFDPEDEYWGLPRTAGHELVAGLCSYCHSLRIVMQQHATERRWSEILDWMVARQGMPALAPQDRAVVLEYLVRHFGSGEAAISGGKSSSP